jgi:hypothetical protein
MRLPGPSPERTHLMQPRRRGLRSDRQLHVRGVPMPRPGCAGRPVGAAKACSTRQFGRQCKRAVKGWRRVSQHRLKGLRAPIESPMLLASCIPLEHCPTRSMASSVDAAGIRPGITAKATRARAAITANPSASATRLSWPASPPRLPATTNTRFCTNAPLLATAKRTSPSLRCKPSSAMRAGANAAASPFGRARRGMGVRFIS